MKRMQQISTVFGLTLEQNRLSSNNTMQMYKRANDRANQILAFISQPDQSHEVKVHLLEVMTLINNELKQLAKVHYVIAGQSLTAYVQNCDALRSNPSTYTDVS